jgi:very-short-patch-repair endonuclease
MQHLLEFGLEELRYQNSEVLINIDCVRESIIEKIQEMNNK